jgi:colicin import membrane protein
MPAPFREFGVYFVVAAVLHLALFAFLVVSLERSVPVLDLDDGPEAIEATVVDEALVEAEMERIRAEERRQAQELADAQAAADAAQRRREAEERRARELQRQAAETAEREQREREAREQAEVARLADLERRRRAEEERLAEIERQQQAEAERQRREEEARRQREAEEQARRAREAEEAAARAERERQQRTVLTQWMRDVRAKVERNWIRPENWPPGTSCTVRVSMIPGGEVVQARLLDSCGEAVRDRSVESAALRASPMPMPEDPAVFRREIDLVFRPVN